MAGTLHTLRILENRRKTEDLMGRGDDSEGLICGLSPFKRRAIAATPGGGAALAAHDLNRAARGDKKARKGIRSIFRRAKKGDRKAKKQMALYKQASSKMSANATGPGISLSRWYKLGIS